MGLLVGLPLKLFSLLGHLIFLALRLAVPIAIVVVAVILLRWRRRRRNAASPREEGPQFRGPVYTVDYEEVPEDEDDPEDKETS